MQTLQDCQSYLDNLREHGIQILADDGAFSTVYSHPTLRTVVTKLVFDDPAYISFVKFCLKNQSNPYLPKIYGAKELEFADWKKVWVVFIEKLVRYNSRFSSHGAALKKVYALANGPCINGYGAWRDIIKGPDKHLGALGRFIVNSKYHIDCHGSNYMIRKLPKGEMQLVFTDPVMP